MFDLPVGQASKKLVALRRPRVMSVVGAMACLMVG